MSLPVSGALFRRWHDAPLIIIEFCPASTSRVPKRYRCAHPMIAPRRGAAQGRTSLLSRRELPRPASTPPSPGHCGGPGAAAGLSQRFRTPWKRWPAERLPQGTQGRGGESLPGASRSLSRARSPRPRSAWRIRATGTAAPEVGAARASGAASAAAAAPRAATCTAARARARAAHTAAGTPAAATAVAPAGTRATAGARTAARAAPRAVAGSPDSNTRRGAGALPGAGRAQVAGRGGPACCERSPHPRRLRRPSPLDGRRVGCQKPASGCDIPGQPEGQGCDVRAGRRAAGPAANGSGRPAALGDVAVPARDRVRGDQQLQSSRPGAWESNSAGQSRGQDSRHAQADGVQASKISKRS